MKIVYRNVIWLLFFVAYNYLCLAERDREKIKIGVFFNEDNSQAKLPLDSAIAAANAYSQNVEFEADVKILSETNSFKSSKIVCDLTNQEKGIGAIFGPPSITTSPIIESICANLKILNIQTNWRPSATYSENDTIINIYPNPQLLSKGIALIAKEYLQWKSFVVLYENDDGLIRLQDVLKFQNYDDENQYNSIIVKQLGPGPDYRQLLKEVRNSAQDRIFLDCETHNLLNILTQAKEMKLLEPYHNYFISSLDAHTIDFSVLNTTSNITTIRIFDPDQELASVLPHWNNQVRQHYMDYRGELDLYSVKTESVLMYDAVNLYVNCIKELMATQTIRTIKTKRLSCDEEKTWKWGNQIFLYMTSKTVPNGVSGPIGFDASGRRNKFNIYVAEGSRSNVTAKWSSDNLDTLEILRNQSDSDAALLQRFKTGTMIVSSRLGPPYLREKAPPDDLSVREGNDRYEGYSMDLITEISKILKFNFRFELAEDGMYGNYDPAKGAWNGLIKDILDRKADFAICDLTITHNRRAVVDFSMPFMRLGISILYKKSAKEAVNMFAFLNPFSVEVWIYTATLYLAVSVILYFVARMAPGDWENPHPCDTNPEELENIWDIKNCLWLTLGSIMTQGCDILPKGISSRMATSMWWFFSLIMTSSYTANLAAFLTMEKMEPTIDSAEALAKQTKIKYGTVNGGATQTFFRESNYTTYQKMWKNMEQTRPSVFEKTNAEGVARVRNNRKGHYAFLMESSSIEYEIETKCDLKQVGNWLDTKGYGIAMALDHPYRSHINSAILQLQESGKLSQLKEKWWKKNRDEPSCDDAGGSEDSSTGLALENVGGVFLVLGVGVGIAFLLAIFEFLWNVRNVSVEEHLTYCEALKVELLFALNVWVTKKSTKPNISESSSSGSDQQKDNKSVTHTILQGAGSFLNMNILNKVGTPVSKD